MYYTIIFCPTIIYLLWVSSANYLAKENGCTKTYTRGVYSTHALPQGVAVPTNIWVMSIMTLLRKQFRHVPCSPVYVHIHTAC